MFEMDSNSAVNKLSFGVIVTFFVLLGACAHKPTAGGESLAASPGITTGTEVAAPVSNQAPEIQKQPQSGRSQSWFGRKRRRTRIAARKPNPAVAAIGRVQRAELPIAKPSSNALFEQTSISTAKFVLLTAPVAADAGGLGAPMRLALGGFLFLVLAVYGGLRFQRLPSARRMLHFNS